jgi:hypothetical protein
VTTESLCTDSYIVYKHASAHTRHKSNTNTAKYRRASNSISKIITAMSSKSDIYKGSNAVNPKPQKEVPQAKKLYTDTANKDPENERSAHGKETRGTASLSTQDKAGGFKPERKWF